MWSVKFLRNDIRLRNSVGDCRLIGRRVNAHECLARPPSHHKPFAIFTDKTSPIANISSLLSHTAEFLTLPVSEAYNSCRIHVVSWRQFPKLDIQSLARGTVTPVSRTTIPVTTTTPEVQLFPAIELASGSKARMNCSIFVTRKSVLDMRKRIDTHQERLADLFTADSAGIHYSPGMLGFQMPWNTFHKWQAKKLTFIL